MLEFETPIIECVEKDDKINYGRFVCQPLEQGYGMTIGNSLRRVLLSSLHGAAVTGVKIEGVQHEFMTIPNIIEDVMEIILNLKTLRFKLHGTNKKTLKLKFKGAGEILASDIKLDSDVEILNKTQHIATATKGANLNMELIVEKGRGYNSIDMNKKHNTDINMLAIDSIFTPVRKVNYWVETARVGKRVDFDKLIIEVWTDGSLLPKEALSLAAKVLNQHLEVFVNLSEEGKNAKIMNEPIKPIDSKYSELKVEQLDITNRSKNSLRLQKVETVKDLLEKTEEEISKFRNLGEKSLEEIKEALAKLGLELKKSN